MVRPTSPTVGEAHVRGVVGARLGRPAKAPTRVGIVLKQSNNVPDGAHLLLAEGAERLVPDRVAHRCGVEHRVRAAIGEERTVAAPWSALRKRIAEEVE